MITSDIKSPTSSKAHAPITLEYLCHKTKYSRLSLLLQQPWAMLLDSAKPANNSNQPSAAINTNRYDIICNQPSLTLSFNGKTSQLNRYELHNNNQLISAESLVQSLGLDLSEPLDTMRKLLAHFKPSTSQTAQQYNRSSAQHITTQSNKETQSDKKTHYNHNNHKVTRPIPFNGGWLGYISYDFGRHLETLPTSAIDDINLPQIQMGLYQWAIITDHQLKQTRLYNFGLNKKNWQCLVSSVENGLKTTTYQPEQLNKTDKKPPEQFNLTSPWQSNTNKKQYKKAFSKIQNYIHAGDCYQVNYAQRFKAAFQGSVYKAYQQLTQANQAPFSAFLNFNDHQILSVSPERFIQSSCLAGTKINHIVTQPIKGTRPRHQNIEQDKILANDLKHSEKDRAENLMIVDLLRNDLSRTAAKASVKVTELFGLYSFESVHHLISTVESDLAEGQDNFDLLASTLPGGSITGAPKIRAMEIIEELEPVRRNLYCGIIGFVDFNNNMDSNICIRTLIAKNNLLYCWAGGGLVADSKVEAEYQETFDKLAKILPVLNQNLSDISELNR
jgi:para-aminobenzoate synthetase component I